MTHFNNFIFDMGRHGSSLIIRGRFRPFDPDFVTCLRHAVVFGAIQYAASMVRGRIQQVKEAEINKARQTGWNVKRSKYDVKEDAEIVPPPEKAVDSQIPGIDILELEDAVRALWKEKIFAASGMGCTGPVILVAGEDRV